MFLIAIVVSLLWRGFASRFGTCLDLWLLVVRSRACVLIGSVFRFSMVAALCFFFGAMYALMCAGMPWVDFILLLVVAYMFNECVCACAVFVYVVGVE
jgi:hypothetical protein